MCTFDTTSASPWYAAIFFKNAISQEAFLTRIAMIGSRGNGVGKVKMTLKGTWRQSLGWCGIWRGNSDFVVAKKAMNQQDDNDEMTI